MIGILLLFLLLTQYSSSTDDQFRYERTITITNYPNSNNISTTNFQFMFLINTKQLITNKKMEPGCTDMRFFSTSTLNHNISLNYYIQGGCNEIETIIWIDVPIPIDESEGDYSNITIMFKYGNSLIQSESQEYIGYFFIINDEKGNCENHWNEFMDLYGLMNERYILPSNNFGEFFGGKYHSHYTGNVETSPSINSGIKVRFYSSDPDVAILNDHVHDLSFMNLGKAVNLPPYVNVDLCYSQKLDLLPKSTLLMINKTYEDNLYGSKWQRYGKLDDRYPRINSNNVGEIGGNFSHHHEFPLSTYDLYGGSSYTCEKDTNLAFNNIFGYPHVFHDIIANSSIYGEIIPPYVSYVFIKSLDSTNIINDDQLMILSNKKPPMGWDVVNNIDNRLIRGSDVLKTGGNLTSEHFTHSHTFDFNVEIARYNSSEIGKCKANGGSNYVSLDHQHHVSSSTYLGWSEIMPEYYSFLLLKRKESPSYILGDEISGFITCFGVSDKDNKVCFSRGYCIKNDVCNCSSPFYGKKCEEKISSCRFESENVIKVKYEISLLLLVDVIDSKTNFNCSIMFDNTILLNFGISPICSWEVESFSTTNLVITMGTNFVIEEYDTIIIKPITNADDIYAHLKILPFVADYSKFDVKWVFYGIIPVSLISICLIFICIVLLCICSSQAKKQKKKLLKFEELGNVDYLLKEQELEKESTFAKIRINKKLFEIDYQSLKIIKQINQGKLSMIYLAEMNGESVCFKCFKISSFTSGFEEFEREITILANLKHFNILPFYGATLSNPRIGIITKYCKFGDTRMFLENYKIENKKSFDLNEKIRLLKEISMALIHLHSKMIIHRDLKCKNCLVDEKLEVRVCDFGMSKVVESMKEAKTVKIGSSNYMAPEITLGQKYNEKVDVFSFGIVIYEIITENFNPYSEVKRKNQTPLEFLVAKNKDIRPRIIKKQFQGCEFLIELIQLCLSHLSEKRPSFERILQLLILKNKDLGKKANTKGDIEKSEDKTKFYKELEKVDSVIIDYERIINSKNEKIKNLKEKIRKQRKINKIE